MDLLYPKGPQCITKCTCKCNQRKKKLFAMDTARVSKEYRMQIVCRASLTQDPMTN